MNELQLIEVIVLIILVLDCIFFGYVLGKISTIMNDLKKLENKYQKEVEDEVH